MNSIAFWNFPKSEQTIIRHKYHWNGLDFKNDMGFPCFYRVLDGNKDLGRVQYYGGKLLAVHGIKTE